MLLDEPDLSELIAAVTAERPDEDLSGAVVRSGWENVVLQTDGWIYRFPRPGVDFDRELAVLRRLSGRLPVPIPEVEWTGSRIRFAAYRALTGASFDVEAYERAPEEARNRLARSLAGFLTTMHDALTPEETKELNLPLHDGAPTAHIMAELHRVPRPARAAVDELVAEIRATWEAGTVPGPRVVLHNDFHLGNMVLDAPVGEMTGIWDFSCVALGEPTSDLRYLVGRPADLLPRVASEYERLSGRRVDLRAAVLANRIEEVADQLEMGTEERLVEFTRSWQAEDAGTSAG